MFLSIQSRAMPRLLTSVFWKVPFQGSLHKFHFKDIDLVQKQDD